MATSYDVVIVGAGHNGLTTAAYLARRGLSVKVLEARPVIGGAAVTEEFHPGFRNSTCSYLVGLLSPIVIEDLDLFGNGLELRKRPAEGFFPLPDGRYILMDDDVERTVAQLDALHPGDGEGFHRLEHDLHAVVGLIRKAMERRPPNLGVDTPTIGAALALASEGRRLSRDERALLLRLMTSSVSDMLDRYFGGEAVKGAFGYLAAVGNYQSPHAPGSAYVLLHHAFGETNGTQGAWGHAVGGMGAVSAAIAKSGQKAGVEIEVNARVAKILTRGGRATGVVLEDGREILGSAVVANVHPKLLYGKLIERALLPDQVVADIAHYRSASGTVRINVALSELPDFTALPGKELALQHCGSIEISPSIEYLDQAYDDAKRGGWAREPIIDMWISSTIDETLAPPGQHVASLFCQHFSPVLSDGRNWDDHRDEVADLIINTMGKYAPNFPGAVIGRRVLTPTDLEREFSLVGGDIFHGSLHLDQIFAMRPLPGFADYRTPVPGVYLCGSGAHPGGGVTGLPGRNAAIEIWKDFRARRLRRAA